MPMTISDVQKDAVLEKLLKRLEARDRDDHELEGDILNAFIGVKAPDAKRWYGSGRSILKSLEEAIAFALRISPSKKGSIPIQVSRAKGVEQIAEIALGITRDAIARHRQETCPALPGDDVTEDVRRWRRTDQTKEGREAWEDILAPKPDYATAALKNGFQVIANGDWHSRSKDASYGSAEDACLDWDIDPIMTEPVMILKVPPEAFRGLTALGQKISPPPHHSYWTIYDVAEAKAAWWTVCEKIRTEAAAKGD